MPRVKRGVTARARHKKIFTLSKGYRLRRNNVFRVAKQAVMRAGQYAYRDRRDKKHVFRRLWIARINAGSRANGLSYSVFMNGLNLRKERLKKAPDPRGSRSFFSSILRELLVEFLTSPTASAEGAVTIRTRSSI